MKVTQEDLDNLALMSHDTLSLCKNRKVNHAQPINIDLDHCTMDPRFDPREQTLSNCTHIFVIVKIPCGHKSLHQAKPYNKFSYYCLLA